MKIGIIGGSGLYDIEGFEQVTRVAVATPFGPPSDEFLCGVLCGRDVVFLPRHGRGHRILPSEINYRANIYALKHLGVECVVSVSAVGSLREELRPRDIVLPDQYFDRTKNRDGHTFFGAGIVAHVAFAEPACRVLREAIADAACKAVTAQGSACGVKIHTGGTYVNMEGPAFSTKAESHTYRKLGFDVIGMTSLAEAKLCREAELCYQAISMVTDYDCWRESEESVSVELVVGHLTANSRLAREIVQELIPAIPESRECGCEQALQHAIMTAREAIPPEAIERLRPIVCKYLGTE